MIRRGSRGFTLIEMLVTLGLFSTLMASISGMLWSVSRAQKEAAQLGEVDRIARMILQRLTHDLEGCVLTTSRYHEQTGFVGTDLSEGNSDADSLQFISSAGRIEFNLDWNVTRKTLIRQTDLIEVAYRLDLDPATDEVGLYRRVKRQLTSLSTDEATIWRERQLAPEVTSFALRYGDGKGTWADSWDSKSTEKRPPVVQIVLEIDLNYKTRTPKELDELREAEEDGMRHFERGKFYKLIALRIQGMPDLAPAEEGGGEMGGGNE